MTNSISYPDYYDCYEYHGSTTIELTRKQNGTTIWRDWICSTRLKKPLNISTITCVTQ